MNILTNQHTTEFESINQALSIQGFPTLKSESELSFLGEGAWHYAYLVQTAGEQMVIRLPKKVAYDKPVKFDEPAFHAEYGGTKAYYEHANRAVEGICPRYFNYYVSEELTFTIEAYVGKTIPLTEQNVQQSFHYGRHLGNFFRAKEQIPTPIEGFGYLKWKDDRLAGQLDMNLKEFINQETEEYEQELNELIESDLQFDKRLVERIGEELIPQRSNYSQQLTFTNQDTSPENLIFGVDHVRLIDPYPIIYTGISLAANHVHNYQVLFPTFYNVPRYRKHRFDRVEQNLHAIADGFVEGYTGRAEDVRHALNVEVFLKHVTMAHSHYRLLQNETLDSETGIRYGTKHQIEDRLKKLLHLFEKFA